MKKKILSFVLLFFTIILLTGCNNRSASINSIEDAKTEIESIVTDVTKGKKLTPENFRALFLMFGRDFITELEEKYNNGDQICLKYDDEVIDGKIIGEDKNDDSKYYFYIENEKYSDLWAYGTIDLTTGNISWQTSY